MPITTPIKTRLDVIRVISDIRFDLIIWAYSIDRTSFQYQLLDDYSEELNRLHRELARRIINEGTNNFQRLATSLEKHNGKLLQLIGHTDKIANTLTTLAQFIEVVEELHSLAPTVTSPSTALAAT